MTDTPISEARTRRVLVSTQGPAGWLRIDNPARMNAMSHAMWKDLVGGVEALAADDAVRVIIVAGHDGRAFCAGADISEFSEMRAGADSAGSYDSAGHAAMQALLEVNKPTIAMIEGYCLGGGLGLALQCDLRFATQSSKLGIPAAKRGIVYSYQGIKQLVDLVGPASAKDILYTARQLTGAEAHAIGLVNRTVPDDEIGAVVGACAEAIAQNAPLSVRATKAIVDMATGDPRDRDLVLCARLAAECLESEDYKEATRSFMEKRQPVFQGR